MTRRPWASGYFAFRRLRHFMKMTFSMKAYRRRAGAADVLGSIKARDYKDARALVFFDHDPAKLIHNRADLSAHMKKVEIEFSGQPEIFLLHAKLITLLRRQYRVEECFAEFEKLWREERDFLLQNLNLRWLISANDTFFDFAEDPKDRLIAGWTSILVNTIKLSETERRYSLNTIVPDAFAERKAATIELFDGLRSFWIGLEDTLRNMRHRLERLSDDGPCSRIFWEVFARLQEKDTVYSRFRALHEKPRTSWW